MNFISSILHRIPRDRENEHPSINPATPVIYTFGTRRLMKSIDKYANIGIYKRNGESSGITRHLDGRHPRARRGQVPRATARN